MAVDVRSDMGQPRQRKSHEAPSLELSGKYHYQIPCYIIKDIAISPTPEVPVDLDRTNAELSWQVVLYRNPGWQSQQPRMCLEHRGRALPSHC